MSAIVRASSRMRSDSPGIRVGPGRPCGRPLGAAASPPAAGPCPPVLFLGTGIIHLAELPHLCRPNPCIRRGVRLRHQLRTLKAAPLHLPHCLYPCLEQADGSPSRSSDSLSTDSQSRHLPAARRCGYQSGPARGTRCAGCLVSAWYRLTIALLQVHSCTWSQLKTGVPAIDMYRTPTAALGPQ